MPNPILSSPHQTRSLPRTQHPLSSPRSHPNAPDRQNRPSSHIVRTNFSPPATTPLTPRRTSPPTPALPLLITKNIPPSPHQTHTRLAPPTPRRTRPSKSALPLLITKNILPSPRPTPTRLASLTPQRTRPPKPALIPLISTSLFPIWTLGDVFILSIFWTF